MLNTFETAEDKHMRKLEIERQLKEMERVSRLHTTGVQGEALLDNETNESNLSLRESSRSASAMSSSSSRKSKTFKDIVADVDDDEGSHVNLRDLNEEMDDVSQSWRLLNTARERGKSIFERDEDSLPRRRCSRRQWVIYSLIATLLLVLTITLSVTLPGGGGEKEPSPQNTEEPPSPSEPNQPNPEPESQAERLSLLKDVLVQQNVLTSSALDDVSSPQNLALIWVSDSDIGQLVERSHVDVDDWTKDPVSRQMIELYALAVFYFSTNGNDWDGNTRWLQSSADNPCDYEGVTCAQHTVSQDETNTGFSVISGLDLEEAGLQGMLPSEISLLRGLLSLELGTNYLTGTLPTDFSQLILLEDLKLENNELSSTIPNEWRNMMSLISLNLQDNDLSGGLPDSLISGWSSVESLSLYENSFTGPIPTAIGTLGSLKVSFLGLVHHVNLVFLPAIHF